MTINVSLNPLANLQNETTAVTQINQNSNTITSAFSSALNTTGDQMQGNLDMNSNQVLNLPSPATANSPLRLQDISSLNAGTFTNIPAGGAAGDVLIKTSSTSYAIGWSANPSDDAAGLNIVLSGSSPVTIATVTSPVFTSLTVSNSISASTITASTITATTVTAAVPAGTLTGTTLAGNVITSSLTSLGTVVNLRASGNAGFGTETNPQGSFVFSQNPLTGITPPTSTSAMWQFGVSGAVAGYNAVSYSNQVSNFLYRADGTASTPTAVASTEMLGSLVFLGHNGTTFYNAARMVAVTEENFSASTGGTYIEFDTTASGTISRTQGLRIMGGVIIGTGTTDPGRGNIALPGASIYSGTGAPTSVAPQGSIFLRSDGGALTSRMYINTNGVSTWTAVSTVG